MHTYHSLLQTQVACSNVKIWDFGFQHMSCWQMFLSIIANIKSSWCFSSRKVHLGAQGKSFGKYHSVSINLSVLNSVKCGVYTSTPNILCKIWTNFTKEKKNNLVEISTKIATWSYWNRKKNTEHLIILQYKLLDPSLSQGKVDACYKWGNQ